MPLTAGEIENIETGIQERELLTSEILKARDDLYALTRIHGNVSDVGCAAVIAEAKLRTKAAADTLSAAVELTF